MTTIVATIAANGDIHMAADVRYSDVESGAYWESEQTPKIAARNNVAYGVAGDQQIVQHIIYGWEPPYVDILSDPMLAMHTSIMPSLREHIGDMDGEWEVLIGFNKTLFLVDKTGFTHDDRTDFAAIGSGAAYALGYMEGAIERYNNLERYLGNAIVVAAQYNANTSRAHTLVVAEYDETF